MARGEARELRSTTWSSRRLKELHLAPSALCTDEQFLRRATLDLIGLPPTAAEYRRFLANPDRSEA